MHEKNQRLEPLSDSVFSFMFSDKAMKPSLLEIINSVLGDAGDTQIEDVQEFKAQYDVQRRMIDSHGGRVDVRAKATDGALFDIEVQLGMEEAMNARSWFYGSGIMSEEFAAGKAYGEMPKVRIINILDFELRKGARDFLQPIKMMYVKQPEEATDAFRIYNIELPKYRANDPTLESVREDPLLCWLYLLDKGYANEHELKELSEMTEGMRAFAAKYNVSLGDPDLKRMYDYEMSARRDHASAIAQAENRGEERGVKKGRAEGRAEGERKKAIETAQKMLEKGMPVELIAELNDLSLSEVNALKAQMRG